jgi:hypothetical protein
MLRSRTGRDGSLLAAPGGEAERREREVRGREEHARQQDDDDDGTAVEHR